MDLMPLMTFSLSNRRSCAFKISSERRIPSSHAARRSSVTRMTLCWMKPVKEPFGSCLFINLSEKNTTFHDLTSNRSMWMASSTYPEMFSLSRLEWITSCYKLVHKKLMNESIVVSSHKCGIKGSFPLNAYTSHFSNGFLHLPLVLDG